MAFRNYLEGEDDKPYFHLNSLAHYYEEMQRYAALIKEMTGYIKDYGNELGLTKEEIDQRVTAYILQNKAQLDQRLGEWDEKLQQFDGSVTDLLAEWVEDGTLNHIIDTTLIDEKIQPLTALLAGKLGGSVKVEPEDWSERSLALATGEGTINLLTIPQNDSVTVETLADDTKELLNNKVNKIKVKNVLLTNNFDTQDNWPNLLSVTNSVVNNEIVFTATAKLGQIRQNMTSYLKLGNKYYFGIKVKSASPNVAVGLFNGGTQLNLKYHTGNGEYELLSFVETIPLSITKIELRILDYSSGTWLPISVKQALSVDLTSAYGNANEPTLTEFESVLVTYNAGSTYVNSTLNTPVVSGVAFKLSDSLNDKIASVSKKPTYVKIANGVLNVINKYSETEDMRIVMQKRGNNNIFEIHQIYLIPNIETDASKDITAGTLFQGGATDWFGPLKIKAVTNINGDLPDSNHVTGGNHAYTGGADGSPTGRTSFLEFYVDGRKVTEFEGNCNRVDVYWENRIQATNTKKEDGTGREVLKQNIHFRFEGEVVSFDSTFEVLEPITWLEYYGVQCSNSAWDQRIFYHSSANKKWNDGKLSSNSIDKGCALVTLNKGKHYLDMFVDNTFGLGKKEKLVVPAYSAYSTTSRKTYIRLVDGVFNYDTGEVESFKGSYRFYSVGIH